MGRHVWVCASVCLLGAGKETGVRWEVGRRRRVDKKRKVLPLSLAERAGEEKRSSYWWLSRRWALGFAELSSLKASRRRLRGAIYFQPGRTGGGLDSGTQGQPATSGVEARPARALLGLNDRDAPTAPNPPSCPGLSLGRPWASHSWDIKLGTQGSARKGVTRPGRWAKQFCPSRSLPGPLPDVGSATVPRQAH